MIVHPGLLVNPAKESGIAVPDDLRDYDPEQYPHWDVFMFAQLGRPMPSANSHFENAKLIGAVEDDRIKEMTAASLLQLGVV